MATLGALLAAATCSRRARARAAADDDDADFAAAEEPRSSGKGGGRGGGACLHGPERTAPRHREAGNRLALALAAAQGSPDGVAGVSYPMFPYAYGREAPRVAGWIARDRELARSPAVRAALRARAVAALVESAGSTARLPGHARARDDGGAAVFARAAAYADAYARDGERLVRALAVGSEPAPGGPGAPVARLLDATGRDPRAAALAALRAAQPPPCACVAALAD